MIRGEKILLLVFLTGLLAMLALATPILTGVRTGAWQILVSTVGRFAGFDPLDQQFQLSQQLASLKAENLRLKSELVDYSALKKQLASNDFNSLRKIPATVFSSPVDIWQTEFKIINRGLQDGITVGAPAVINDSILVGFVVETSNKQATLRKLNHPETSLPVQVVIDDETETSALVTGNNYTAIEFSVVLREFPIELGQKIVTDQTELTPKGLLIGEVERVTSDESSAYHEGVVKQAYDPESIRAVNVLVQP